MSVIPTKKQDQLEFHNIHAPIFAENEAALDLSTTQTATYTALAAAAQADYDAAGQAESDYRAAVTAQNNSLDLVNSFGSQLIKSIRAYAIQTQNNSIYATAQIPMPKSPAPVPPVNPSNVRFDLNGNGSLLVEFDGVLTVGTVFEIWRRVTDASGTTSPDKLVGVRGTKSFTDSTIPAGTKSASYSIKAVKGSITTTGTEWTVASFVVGSDGGTGEGTGGGTGGGTGTGEISLAA